MVRGAIIFGGFLSLALAIFHSFFYSYFNWKDDFKNISVVNARVFVTLHVGLIAVFLFYAFLSFSYTAELGQSNGLAGMIVGFYAFVWLFRTVWQLTYLNPLRYEKPVLHYLLTVWFLALFVAYSVPIAVKLTS